MDTLGVVFDMDGVLVDSSEAHFAAWRRLGERIGVPCTREFFERSFGMHNRQIIPLWLGDGIATERLEELSLEKEAMYREVARDNVRPLPGVVALVRALAGSGFRLAVGSSGPEANVTLILEILGIADRFDALSTGDQVQHGKPHPEVFLLAAAALGLEPRRCAVIEDAPQGVEAGLAAGCTVIAVTSTRPAAELATAHRVVESLEDLDAAAVRRAILEHGAR